jgi:putative transposase
MSWARRGERKRVPYENPQRRRLNAMAVSMSHGADRSLYWMLSRRHFGADDLVHFLRALPPAPVPTVIALDNANFHRSHAVRDARPELRERGIYLYFLPSYSPKLNDIERLFRTIKHHELPERTYPTLDGLELAVDNAFARCEAKLLTQDANQPRQAA